MKQDVLKFDIDEINNMKDKLPDIATRLEKCKTDVLESIEELRTDWNTAAGKKFMSQVNDDWTEEVKNYIKIIEAVEKLLQEAVTQYTNVESLVEELKFYPD